MNWQSNGVQGWSEHPPPVVGNFSGTLVVMGGARCVWQDVSGLEEILPRNACSHMAINDVGQFWHYELTHWATLHPNYMQGWRHFRMGHGYGNGMHVHTHSFANPSSRRWPEIDIWWEIDFPGGASGMFGVYVGLALGYNKIVLVGIPMDDQVHFFDPPWYVNPGLNSDAEAAVWTSAQQGFFNNRVKSMSGRTKIWCGPPTEEWLHGDNN